MAVLRARKEYKMLEEVDSDVEFKKKYRSLIKQ
jgi:hypothetical protein